MPFKSVIFAPNSIKKQKMKKYILAFALGGMVLSASADLTSNGYYRVQNYGSSRWANLVDNKAEVDKVSATAELHALELTKNTEEILSDPGSIVLLTKQGGDAYDIAAQGISLESLMNQNIYIANEGTGANGQKLYYLYGTYKGATKYIGDARMNDNEIGLANVNVTNKDYRRWYILPVSANSDNYFGVKPSLNIDGTQYATVFASFAYKPYSAGVKAYYIANVGYGMAEMVEITDAVPAGAPVIIQCAGTNVADNKMELLNVETALPSNALTGVYFDYQGKEGNNIVKYDPNTMRVLGKCSDGSLGFVIDNSLTVIPSNTAYLKVPAGSAPEYKCVDSATFAASLPELPDFFKYGDYELLPQGKENYTLYIENFPAGENIKFRFSFTDSNNEEQYIGAVSANNSDVNISIGETYTYPFAYASENSWVLKNWPGGDLTLNVNVQYQYVNFYSKNAGVDTITADSGLIYDGHRIINNTGAELVVYDMAGKKVAATSQKEFETDSLPKGVYVATAAGKTVKIIR